MYVYPRSDADNEPKSIAVFRLIVFIRTGPDDLHHHQTRNSDHASHHSARRDLFVCCHGGGRACR